MFEFSRVENFCKGSKICILRVAFCGQLRCKKVIFRGKFWACLSKIFILPILRVGLYTAIPRSPEKNRTHCGIFVAIPHAAVNDSILLNKKSCLFSETAFNIG